ncbi:phosphoribosylglycinamide formyltransferase [Aestuariibacter sp. AA17]|uniref:Phosphoribosylglycinamide formyltransferase n=1 Tax=Fluctibacter corallii TaxID=2984329 RepID=A0ABT3A5T1_9ALTE|nr:phosphoribosylglycinamide formyltransferase [Aestuariibacter sp. AA17]MCV2884037.1 phosphoribosylglycinamide formyltransferase [Aestuariibacter sp. AA17]
MSDTKKRIVVLISGNGSNLQAILDRSLEQNIHGQVVAVISNRPDAYGLTRAEQREVDTQVLDHTEFETREAYDYQLKNLIDSYHPDLVVLAGFMRILSDPLVMHYHGRMLNIHPSLLPKYKGLNTHSRAIEAGDTEHGASVHFVTPELDDGPVVIQSKVPVFKDDTELELAARVQEQERNIYPLVIEWFCRGRLTMENNKAYLDGNEIPENGYAAD